MAAADALRQIPHTADKIDIQKAKEKEWRTWGEAVIVDLIDVLPDSLRGIAALV